MTTRFSQGTIEREVLPARLLPLVVDDVPGEQQPERRSDDDRGERDERGLEQEGRLHHSAAESDRAQHADLLPPLDDGAGADHAERGDADERARGP